MTLLQVFARDAVCLAFLRMLAGIVVPILLSGSASGILSGGFLQPRAPGRHFRVGPSFLLLFAPGITLA